MKIHSAYLAMIKAVNGGWETMVQRLDMTRPSLQNRIYGLKNQSVDVDLALQMQAISETTLFAEAIATASGGVFVKLPDVTQVDNESLLGKFMELQTEFGQLSQKFADATKDGEIDTRERADLEAIGDEMHRTMSELTGLMFRIYCRAPAPDTLQDVA